MLKIYDLNLDKKLAIGIALVFSSEVLHLFETKYPNDLRPRGAIESAIRCLHNPCKETRDAYDSAAAADAADDAAYAAARAAAYSAYAVARANAAFAAHAAAAGYAAYAAARANAAYAADKDKYIHDRIVKILPLIVEYKIENKQSFNDAEKVLENLSDEDKMSFLFNLDILR